MARELAGVGGRTWQLTHVRLGRAREDWKGQNWLGDRSGVGKREVEVILISHEPV